jgi:hypothetical protein
VAQTLLRYTEALLSSGARADADTAVSLLRPLVKRTEVRLFLD